MPFSYDGPPALENAATNEVAQCKWMAPEEIKAPDSLGQPVPTLRYFFTKLTFIL